jgi:hypothetical protein
MCDVLDLHQPKERQEKPDMNGAQLSVCSIDSIIITDTTRSCIVTYHFVHNLSMRRYALKKKLSNMGGHSVLNLVRPISAYKSSQFHRKHLVFYKDP